MIIFFYRTLMILGLTVLPGCSTVESWMPWYSEVKLESIQFVSESGIESNRAVTFDLVFISDDALAVQFQKIAADEWFTQKKAYLTGYPIELDLMSWEMVPGFPTTFHEMPGTSDEALIAVMFANFPEPSFSKVILTNISRARITLSNDGLILMEIDNARTGVN